jgi:hypothetical protein
VIDARELGIETSLVEPVVVSSGYTARSRRAPRSSARAAAGHVFHSLRIGEVRRALVSRFAHQSKNMVGPLRVGDQSSVDTLASRRTGPIVTGDVERGRGSGRGILCRR